MLNTFAAEAYVVTDCGVIVYTDTSMWTDEELQHLGDILSDFLCDENNDPKDPNGPLR